MVYYEHLQRHLRSVGSYALKEVSSNLRALAKKGLLLNAAVASCVLRFIRLFNNLEL